MTFEESGEILKNYVLKINTKRIKYSFGLNSFQLCVRTYTGYKKKSNIQQYRDYRDYGFQGQEHLKELETMV